MIRLSRLDAPRATLAAIALLAVVLLGFGAIASAQLPESAVFASHSSAAGTFTLGDVLGTCGLRGSSGGNNGTSSTTAT